MGRLAGSSPRWEDVLRKTREDEGKRRQAIAAATPVVHPPASRRLIALLWYIENEIYGSMTVGRRGYPPLTDDMRALLRKKYLVMKREQFYPTMRLPLCNVLVLTPAGKRALAGARVTDADKAYVKHARNMWVLR
jgi:hypothetical protein